MIRTKLAFISNFGRAHSSHEIFINDLKESPYFFVLFDESLNVCSEFSKWISSDIGVREKMQIEKRYFDLKFLGHTTSFNHVMT